MSLMYDATWIGIVKGHIYWPFGPLEFLMQKQHTHGRLMLNEKYNIVICGLTLVVDL